MFLGSGYRMSFTEVLHFLDPLGVHWGCELQGPDLLRANPPDGFGRQAEHLPVFRHFSKQG